MILVIDNYDSFTYNLVQYLGELGAAVEVHRNDAISVEDIAGRAPEAVLISPGPGNPDEAGITLSLLANRAGHAESWPVLGVCLGHQAIGQAFGGRVVSAQRLMHGRTSAIHHTGVGIFSGLPDPFTATRYHSLVVERESLGPDLEITAWSDDGEIMGLRHKRLPIQGVQFHPESFLTEHGHALLQNFLQELPDRGRIQPRNS
jgi:anthranilate synthase/aminodeoxychorismate synthase-like glutamine amidotransferase